MNDSSSLRPTRQAGWVVGLLTHGFKPVTRAVGPLFDRHYDALFATADRLLGDPHLAADAVQETFLRVMRDGGLFAARSALRSWLLRVVHNLPRSHLLRDRGALRHIGGGRTRPS